MISEECVATCARHCSFWALFCCRDPGLQMRGQTWARNRDWIVVRVLLWQIIGRWLLWWPRVLDERRQVLLQACIIDEGDAL